MTRKAGSAAGREFLTRSWKGDKELWTVFWVPGLIVMLLMIPGIYAAKLDLPMAWWAGYVLINICAQIWWIVSVWRCAENTRNALWTVLARIIAAFAGVNLIFKIFRIFL